MSELSFSQTHNKYRMMEDRDICCVCHHSLNNHIDEDIGWRCHSLDSTRFQCECWLRKNKVESKDNYSIYFRDEEMIKESKIGEIRNE